MSIVTVKKLCWHSTFGEIGVEEPQYRRGSKRLRAFATSAKVKHRCCSYPLQRAVTDFGADVPFARVMDKLVEHYGVILPESTIRRVTEGHAVRIALSNEQVEGIPNRKGEAQIVVEMDGGMVPIVEPDSQQTDRRKGKHLKWREAKLCLAHVAGSKSLQYGGTLEGDVSVAGQQLLACAVRVGVGKESYVHAVGDGAPWIADQVEVQFGAQDIPC